MPTFYAYQTIITDISTYYVKPLMYKTIDEIFVPGSICFMLGHPHYGAMGEVFNITFASMFNNKFSFFLRYV